MSDECRKAIYNRVQDQREAQHDRERAGRFVVCRCKKCGRQLHRYACGGEGALFCAGRDMHECEPEMVEVSGPAWQAPDQRAAA